jgi:hypothetical protein
MALTIAQLAATLPPAQAAAVNVLKQTDQLVGSLPWMNINGRTVYPYKRRVANPAVTWAARGATTSVTDALKEVNIYGEIKRVVARQQIDVANAADAGGLPLVMGRKTEGALEAISQSLGAKIITGAMATTATISNAALAASGYLSITDVGPSVLTNRGNGSLKYTHSGTTVQFRAPGDTEYGAAVTCGTNTVVKAYSYNEEQWVEVTHGASALSANDTGDVVFTAGASEFDGMIELIAGHTGQIIYGGTNGGNLSLALLDQLTDLVIAPDSAKVLIMGLRTFRAFKALMRAAGGATMVEYAGAMRSSYNGIPILVSQNVPTTRTRGSASGTCTAAFCASLGQGRGLCGIYSDLVDQDFANARKIVSAMGVSVYDLGLSGDALNSHLSIGHFGLVSEDFQGLAMLDGLLDTSA